MDNEKNWMNDNKLFDETLIDELNEMKPVPNQSPAKTAESNRASFGSQPEKTEQTRETGDKNAGVSNPDEIKTAHSAEENKPDQSKTDNEDSAEKKIFLIRVLAVAVGVLGIIMLISGMVLHRLDEESRKTPEKAQMPEEYIEEFFSDENFKPDIEKYMEPEA